MARIFGVCALASIYSTAYRRDNKTPFHIYVDEAHLYLMPGMGDIMSGCRKFDIFLHLAVQELGQIKAAGERLLSDITGNTGNWFVFNGLDSDEAAYMAEIVFRKYVELEEAKLTHRAAIGARRIWLANESGSTSVGIGTGRNWLEGTSAASHQSETASRSATTSGAETVSAVDGETHTATVPHQDDADQEPRETKGTSRQTGHAVTAGSADTEGRATTRGTSTGTNRSAGGNASYTFTTTQGRGRTEGFETVYDDVVSQYRDWSEQLKRLSWDLATTPVGTGYVRIGHKFPRRLITPEYDPPSVVPELYDLVTRRMRRAVPGAAIAADVDEELRAREEALRTLACSGKHPAERLPTPDEDDSDDEAWQQLAERARRGQEEEP